MTRLPGPPALGAALSPGCGRAPTRTLPRLLSRSLQEHAGKLAVVDEDHQLSYGELHAWSQGTAEWLASHVQPGDRIALWGRNTARMVVADTAVMLAGLVRVGLTPRLTPEEVAAILADAGVAVLFADSDRLSLITPIAARLPDPPAIVALGDERAAGCEAALGELRTCSGGKNGKAGQCAEPDWVSHLFYTSGTTGVPKGAVVTQHAMSHVVEQMCLALPDLNGSERVLHTAPLAHISGVVMLASLIRGGTQYPLAKFDPDLFLDAIERQRVTVAPLVPTMINALEPVQRSRPREIGCLTSVFYSGSPIAPSKLRAAVATFGPVFIQSYALTEAPLALTEFSRDDHARAAAAPGHSGLLSSAGKPLPFVEITTLDEAGQEQADNRTGEIAVRSETMMHGYWRNPEETRRAFTESGWLRTGDVGYIDTAGYLYITDRLKEIVVTGGFNVSPAEVENVVYELEYVAECAVIGIPDETWGEAVTLIVALDKTLAGGTPHAELTRAVLAHCRHRLADYKVPKTIEISDELPKSPAGKILRRALRDRYWGNAGRYV